MLEVEDWTQPSQHNKQRVSARKVSSKNETKQLTLASSTPELPPGSLQAEVEDSFRDTHSPTSHLFPVRTRSNSSPPVRPSSLSRLLAQAPPETQLETIPPSRTRTPSPTTSPPPPPSPSQYTGSVPHHVPVVPSPLRPGSRASRLSSTSRFSVGLIPPLGSSSLGSPSAAKAAPTIALSDQPLMSSPSGEANPFGSPTTPSSAEGSIPEGMIDLLKNRRRTTSYHIPRTSPLAGSSTSHTGSTSTTDTVQPTSTASGTLANLANNWGVSLGRKKRTRLSSLATFDAGGSADHATDASASELLKRF